MIYLIHTISLEREKKNLEEGYFDADLAYGMNMPKRGGREDCRTVEAKNL